MAAQISSKLSKIGIQVDFPINFNILVDKLDNSLDWECYLLGFTGVEPNSGSNLWSPEGGSHSFNKPQAGRPPIEGRGCRLGGGN